MKKSSAKFFGKSLLALALGIIAVAGLAVAGLLSYYGKITGTARVSQSVLVDGKSVPDSMTSLQYSISDVKGGETFTTDEHTITDQSSANAPITLTTEITEASCPQNAECTTDTAIEFTYYTFYEVIGTGDGSTKTFTFKPMMSNPTNVKATDGSNTVDCSGPDSNGYYSCTFDTAPSNSAQITGSYNVNGNTASGTVTGEKTIKFTFSAKTKVNAIPGGYSLTTTIATS